MEEAFTAAVFSLLIKENKISRTVAAGMNQWEHSGFHIYCGEHVTAYEGEAIEKQYAASHGRHGDGY